VGPFAYDPSGNVAIIGGSYSIYDPMSRLVTSSVQRPDQMGSQVNTYGYDVYGNRTTVDGVATYAASTSTNQLTGVGAVYNDAGNLTQWQPPGSAFPRRYTYDSLNMITNEVTGGQAAANIYTPDDERLWRYDATNNVSHWTVRDLGGKVLRDFLDDPNDSNGAAWTLYREYIYRDGQLLAVNAPTGTEHYSLDHLGSPRLVTDGNRNRIFHHHYLPFGGEWTIGNESVDGSTLRFTGHERDDDPLDQQNGTLDYLHARFYSANLGRFLSTDPLGVVPHRPQTWNRYSYVLNDPLSYADPTGLCVQEPEKPPCTDMIVIVTARDPGSTPVDLSSSPAARAASANSALREAELERDASIDRSALHIPFHRMANNGADYLSLNVNVAIPTPWTGTLFGLSFQVAGDRYGNLYWSPLGAGVGKTLSGVSASVTAGWLNQPATPSAEQMEGFMTANSFNVAAGSFFGAGLTYVPNQVTSTATELGLFTPQVGGSYHYSFGPVHPPR
jgi:RHS repeat-associated protein